MNGRKFDIRAYAFVVDNVSVVPKLQENLKGDAHPEEDDLNGRGSLD